MQPRSMNPEIDKKLLQEVHQLAGEITNPRYDKSVLVDAFKKFGQELAEAPELTLDGDDKNRIKIVCEAIEKRLSTYVQAPLKPDFQEMDGKAYNDVYKSLKDVIEKGIMRLQNQVN